MFIIILLLLDLFMASNRTLYTSAYISKMKNVNNMIMNFLCVNVTESCCDWQIVLMFNADVIIWSIGRFRSVLLNASAAGVHCPLSAFICLILRNICSYLQFYALVPAFFIWAGGIEKSFVPFSAPLCSGLSLLLPGSQSCITLWTRILSFSFLFSPCLSLYKELLRVSFVFVFSLYLQLKKKKKLDNEGKERQGEERRGS